MLMINHDGGGGGGGSSLVKNWNNEITKWLRTDATINRVAVGGKG